MSNFLQKPYLYLLIILIGTGLKFYKLEQQFFWDDEIASITHTSGIPMEEFGEDLPVNQAVNKDRYLDLLNLNDRGLNIIDQITGLAKMPQLTPGHYYYLIFWIRLFGDGLMAYRYFSVFIFILSLPFLFLLARKIFSSDLAGWIAVSLFSVSPFFQLYAQEARYYILWSLAMILLHYVFLIAVEKQQRKWWIIYVLTGVLAVHTSILIYFMLVMQGLYYLVFYRDKMKPLIISMAAIFLSSLPWMIYIFIHRNNIQGAMEWHSMAGFGEHTFFRLLFSQFEGISAVFINLKHYSSSELLKQLAIWIPAVLVLASLVLLFLRAEKKQLWFLVLISLSGIVLFLLIDMIRGSFTSLLWRYHMLYLVGFILIVAYGLKLLFHRSPFFFVWVFLLLSAGGILSSKRASDDLCAGKRPPDCKLHIEDAAELFSGEENILIISDFEIFYPGHYTAFMSLLIQCENEHIDVFYALPNYPDFRAKLEAYAYDKVYVMYASKGLEDELRRSFTEDEFVLEKERTMIGIMYLPVYRIQ
jgi:uncharacterized membrane protein